MDMNRNHYFLIGLVILFLGLQLRMVDTFVVNEDTAKFVAEQMNRSEVASTNSMPISLNQTGIPQVRRTIKPPRWIGWSLLSIGGIFVLHSLALRKPGA